MLIKVLFGLFFISVHLAYEYDKDSWDEVSHFLSEGFDKTIDPCEDIMKYACGKLLTNAEPAYKKDIENGQISDTHPNAAQFQSEYTRYQYSVNNLVEEAIQSITDTETKRYKSLVYDYYKKCESKRDPNINTNQNNAIQYIYSFLSYQFGQPSLLSNKKPRKREITHLLLWSFLGAIHRNFTKIQMFFDVIPLMVKRGCNDPNNTAIKLDPFRNDDALNYTTIIKNYADTLNIVFNESNVHLATKEIAKLDEEMRNISKISTFYDIDDKEKRLTNYYLNARFFLSIDQLNVFFSNITWTNYFRSLFLNESVSTVQSLIIINDMYYFRYLGNLIEKSDPEIVYNYMFFKTMKMLEERIVPDNPISGYSSCIDEVSKLFAPAVARIIFDRYGFNATEWNNDIRLIAENVISAFKFFISNSDWIHDDDKLALIGKANYIKFNSGIPEWLANEMEIDKRTVHLRYDQVEVKYFRQLIDTTFYKKLNAVINNIDLDILDDPEFDVNAHYAAMNIYMQLGISLPPWYKPTYPLAVKYAILGFTIGHELMHGFDSNTIEREFPPSFSKKWLKEETIKEFQKRTNCMLKQYSSYCYPLENKCISGKTTLAENIADNDGLKIAYMAYKFAIQIAGSEPPLNNFVNFTGEKIFFLTYARHRCTNNHDVLESIDKNDEHAPNSARLDIPLKNFDRFAKAFECKVGSNFAGKQCHLWGSFDVHSSKRRRI